MLGASSGSLLGATRFWWVELPIVSPGVDAEGVGGKGSVSCAGAAATTLAEKQERATSETSFIRSAEIQSVDSVRRRGSFTDDDQAVDTWCAAAGSGRWAPSILTQASGEVFAR